MMVAIVMIATNAGMNADAANMDPDTNIGARRGSAEHRECKDRSE
jgi:hypothetical protein